MAEVGAAAEPSIGQHAGKAHTRRTHPVDLGQRDLRLGLRRARRLRHPGLVAALRILGPGGGQEQPQPDRQRHLAARQRQRDQHLRVRYLAQFAAVLPRHPDREIALLGNPRVIDHQHGVLAADLAVDLFGQDAPQRRIIPGRAADEVVQRVMTGQAKPLGHRLDALAPARAQQPAHIQRRHLAPRAAPGHVEEGFKPVVEVGVDIAW